VEGLVVPACWNTSHDEIERETEIENAVETKRKEKRAG
jgi:hypothetical protein